MSQNKWLIGYSTVEEWCQAVPQGHPFRLVGTQEPGTQGTHGIATDSYRLLLTAIMGEELHYVMMRTGYVQTIGGKPLAGEDATAAVRRTDQAEQAAKTWLAENGYTNLKPGTVSIPHDANLLRGSAEFIRYDKATDSFMLTRDYNDLIASRARAEQEAASAEPSEAEAGPAQGDRQAEYDEAAARG